MFGDDALVEDQYDDEAEITQVGLRMLGLQSTLEASLVLLQLIHTRGPAATILGSLKALPKHT